MKAIILAAGEGKRMKPLTDHKTKCLVELKGRTLLDYQRDVFKKAKIGDITVVTGFKAEAFHGLEVPTCYNDRYYSTNMVYSFFCAESELNDDVIVSYGDIVFEQRILQALVDDSTDFAVVVDDGWKDLWNFRMADPLKTAETLKIDEEDKLVEIGKIPKSLEEIQSQYIGLFKISKGAISAVKDFYHSLDQNREYDGRNFDNMFMTSFIQNVADRLMKVKAVRVRHGWLELDKVEDWRCYEKMKYGHFLFDFTKGRE